MKKLIHIATFLSIIILIQGCQTGMKAYEKGNYYVSVLQSVDKLRKNPKHKKAKIALADAYPLAIQTLELNNQNLLNSNDPSKWKMILENYNKINRMYEEILRSPAALKIIGTPKNYYAEVDKVKQNAAEETYARALGFLQKGTREDAKKAYYIFQEVETYVTNYKDTNHRIEEARMMATLYVMVDQDPVPAKFAVSGQYFRNKVDEFLHASEAKMEFIEFYNPKEMVELGIQPDHEIVLRYQDFNIGNVYFKESTEHLTRDSIVVATYTREVPAGTTINNEPAGSGAVPQSGSATNTRTSNANKNSNKNQPENLPGSGTTGNNSGNNSNNNNNSNNEKVVICHKPDGGNPQTLEVSKSALQAHLNHGDQMGPCNGNGNTGNNGNSGNTNNAGNTGNSGNTGNTGNSGNSGNTNNTGNTGNSGNTNNSGNTGNTGNSGNTGNTGNSGNSGNTGNSGNSGNTGNSGNSGNTNNTGNTGNSGNTGNTGNTGNSGNTGNTGNTGNSGNTGNTGNSGNTGNTGSGSPAGPTTELVNVYATVKATLVVNEKTVTSNALMSMTIYESNRAGRVVKEEMFPVEHVWVSKWGFFNGDERALSDEQLEITKSKEQTPPDRDATFNMLSEEFYNKITANIREFYRNY